jgi:hypothetical protein
MKHLKDFEEINLIFDDFLQSFQKFHLSHFFAGSYDTLTLRISRLQKLMFNKLLSAIHLALFQFDYDITVKRSHFFPPECFFEIAFLSAIHRLTTSTINNVSNQPWIIFVSFDTARINKQNQLFSFTLERSQRSKKS